MNKKPTSVAEAARRIKLVAFDVDGVLTDGRITYGSSGEELKSFHVRDGHAIKLASRAGLVIAVITGRHSPVVQRRCEELGIDLIYQDSKDKMSALRDIMERTGLEAGEIAFMGDDVVDLPVMVEVGLGCSPADAAPEVRERSSFVTDADGGRGAAREFLFLILREQGLLDDVMKRYLVT